MPLLKILEDIRFFAIENVFHQKPLQFILDEIILHLQREFPKKILVSVVLFEKETAKPNMIAAPGLQNITLAKIQSLQSEDNSSFWEATSLGSDDVSIENAQKHPYWQLCKTTLESKTLDSSLTLPIRPKSNQILGWMVVFYAAEASPHEEELCFFKLLTEILANTVSHFQGLESIQTCEYKFNLMFHGSPVPMFVFDLETFNFLDVNQAALKKYEYSRTEFLKKNLLDIRPEDDRNKLLAFLKKDSHRNAAVMEAGVWRHLKKNGELFYAQISFQPVLIDSKLVGYVWVNDITAQINIQNSLSDQQKQLVNILDSIPEGVFLFRDFCKIYDVNPAGRKLLEVDDLFPLKNKCFVEFIEEPYRDNFLKILHLKKDGRKKKIEVVLLSQKKTKKWIEITATPLHLHGGEVFLLGVIRDLTKEKQNMQLLSEQNESLKKTNNELDRFLYSTSHDLRSPLSSILGILKIVEDQTLESHTKEHVEMIRNRINRLDHLLKDILSFSANKRQEIKPVYIDFHSLVAETINNLMHIETGMKIRFESDINEVTPFYSDAQRISTILENLIGNAIKHHNPSESDPFVRVCLKTFSDRAVLTVEDNGMGIEKDLQKKIFDMFFRVSSRTDGNGIGLYLVKETAKNIGGSIQVESRPNKGSTFTVTLKNYGKDGVD
jgi:PAS domain S-box-containing protein